MIPVVSSLKSRFGQDVAFIIVDVRTADGRELARDQRIFYTPTILLMDGDGLVKERIEGSAEESALADALTLLLQP
jgi:hypothetical protein